MSSSAEVVCGSGKMDFKYLLHVLDVAIQLQLPILPVTEAAAMSSNSLSDPWISLTQLVSFQALGPGEPNFEPWKWIDLLYHGRILLASKSQDYCYGLFGFSMELNDPDLVVDYSVLTEFVYRQFARYFVIHSDGVKVLYNSSGHNINLPFWVPDWSYSHTGIRIVPYSYMETGSDLAYAAAVSISSYIKLHSS